MDDARRKQLTGIEERIGYTFEDESLLDEALTHRSVTLSPDEPDNERLEFLGDAVVDLVVSEMLFRDHPQDREGRMSLTRAQLVSRRTLAEVAERLELVDGLRLSAGELAGLERSRASLGANAFEALVGALYLDGGLEPSRRLVERCLGEEATRVRSEPAGDAKNRLQEWLQARSLPLPTYVTVQELGPPHDRIFEVECRLDDRLLAAAQGTSKRRAEREAAERALDVLRRGNEPSEHAEAASESTSSS